ncbi:MAG: Abi family protein [Akkermansiaceae bacterium]|nr:Abi family protein [Akkermansiaceae bacterium]
MQRLQAVGYYRLSGYFYPFRRTATLNGKRIKLNIFLTGARLKTVWNYYLFDRRLRFLIMDAIERVEIAFRVCVAYEWAKPSGISNPQSLKGEFCQEVPQQAASRPSEAVPGKL